MAAGKGSNGEFFRDSLPANDLDEQTSAILRMKTLGRCCCHVLPSLIAKFPTLAWTALVDPVPISHGKLRKLEFVLESLGLRMATTVIVTSFCNWLHGTCYYALDDLNAGWNVNTQGVVAGSSNGGGEEGRNGVDDVHAEDDAEDEVFVPLAAPTKRHRKRSRAPRGEESFAVTQTAALSFAGPPGLPAPRSVASSFAGPPGLPAPRSVADVAMEAEVGTLLERIAPTHCSHKHSTDTLTARSGDCMIHAPVPPSMGKQPVHEITEEVHQQRISKRRHALATIKATTDYKDFDNSRLDAGRGPSPRTPDAADRTVSKRGWEASVMRWRSALRQRSAAGHASDYDT